jgi:hypothetical protein
MGSAVSGVSWELFAHLKQGTLPDQSELQRWQATLANAATAQGTLLASCEDLIELGASAERLEAVKRAVATANGQHQYVARRDRW